MEFSVVVPCYNCGKYIEDCLESILNQTIKPKEIIVVDDGSKDNSVEKIKRYPVRLVSWSRRGIAQARNIGLILSKGDIVVFFDSDVEVPQDYLEILADDFEHYSDVVAVGGQEIPIVNIGIANVYRSKYLRQTHGEGLIINPPFIYGIASAFKKDAIIKAGYFNPFFRTNGEDVEISIRLKKLGYKLLYDSRLKVYHKRTDSITSLIKTAYRYSYFGRMAQLINRVSTPSDFFSDPVSKIIRFFSIPSEKNLISLDIMVKFAGVIGGIKARMEAALR